MVQCAFSSELLTAKSVHLIVYDKQQWRVTLGGLDLAVLMKSSWREGTRQAGELAHAGARSQRSRPGRQTITELNWTTTRQAQTGVRWPAAVPTLHCISKHSRLQEREGRNRSDQIRPTHTTTEDNHESGFKAHSRKHLSDTFRRRGTAKVMEPGSIDASWFSLHRFWEFHIRFWAYF